jgi:hypothetical protein
MSYCWARKKPQIDPGWNSRRSPKIEVLHRENRIQAILISDSISMYIVVNYTCVKIPSRRLWTQLTLLYDTLKPNRCDILDDVPRGQLYVEMTLHGADTGCIVYKWDETKGKLLDVMRGNNKTKSFVFAGFHETFSGDPIVVVQRKPFGSMSDSGCKYQIAHPFKKLAQIQPIEIGEFARLLKVKDEEGYCFLSLLALNPECPQSGTGSAKVVANPIYKLPREDGNLATKVSQLVWQSLGDGKVLVREHLGNMLFFDLNTPGIYVKNLGCWDRITGPADSRLFTTVFYFDEIHRKVVLVVFHNATNAVKTLNEFYPY